MKNDDNKGNIINFVFKGRTLYMLQILRWNCRKMNRAKMEILVVILSFLFSSWAFGKQYPLPEWQGEFFRKGEGGFFLRVYIKDRASKMRSVSSVQIFLYNPILRKKYYFNQILDTLNLGKNPIWKIPSGKYQILGLKVLDDSGYVWRWRSRSKRFFFVKDLSLSNLGKWTIVQQKRRKISVRYKMIPNYYKEKQSKKNSGIAQVLDGYTGRMQEIFAGKRVFRSVKKNYSTKNELREAYIHHKRQISMRSFLNLFKYNNNFGQKVMNVLQLKDPRLRTCYVDRLFAKNSLKGSVKFKFILSKNTKSMILLKRAGELCAIPK